MRMALVQQPAGHGRPVYSQIADHIRGEIDQGGLEAGERLPPIRSLAVDLGVNRDTVALAYESLATEGLLDSVVGRGTFVRGITRSAPSGASFATLCGSSAGRGDGRVLRRRVGSTGRP